MKERFSKILNNIPIVLVGIYSGIILILLIMSIFTEAPRELRDAANVSFAMKIANLLNTYELNDAHEFIESINVYSPLNMFIAAFLHRLSGINLYQIFYFLDFVYILLGAIIIACFVKKEFRVNTLFALLAFAVSLTLGWRVGFISTIPDHLGMLLCIIIFMRVYKNRNILLNAILTVLAFYCKQYFLAVAMPVFLYYCISNRRKAIQYFVATAGIGCSSLVIMNYFFPSFSVQILFFMFAENDAMNADKIYYSIKQMVLALGTYGIYSLFVIKRYVQMILNIKDFSACLKRITIFDINNIVMFFILLYLGTNKGAFISYHLTLMMPGFVIVGSNEIKEFVEKKHYKKQFAYVISVCIISLALLLKKYGFPYIQTKEDVASYTCIEELLNCYEGKKYLLPQLGYLCVENEMPLAENGHAEYLITLADSCIIRTPINIKECEKVFPYLSELYEYSIDYKEKVLEAIRQQDYVLITRLHGNPMLYGYDIRDKYECIETISVTVGIQNYTIDFYVPSQ